jgi:peptidyl-prolyl cis-trans isomerase-like 1
LGGFGVFAWGGGGPGVVGRWPWVAPPPPPTVVASSAGKHTIFGRVHSGMRVVQKLGMVPTGAEDRPLGDVKIVSATVL